MKQKWLGMLAAAVMMLGLAVGVSAEVVSGNCGKEGDNLTWEYDTETCVLTISGEGEMKDYGDNYYNGSYVTTAPWRTYYTSITTVYLTDTVSTIGNSAFCGCSGITELTLPNSITSIGNSAFYGCSGITELTLPNSITSIGDSAFEICSRITKLTLPDSITSIGNSAFSHCYAITELTLPVSLTSIGNYAFYNCHNIVKLTLPDSLTTIGNYAFQNCYRLKEVTISNAIASLGNYIFIGCTALTAVTLPENLSTIGTYTFSGCNKLTEITFPASLTKIGGMAFGDCTGLTKATFHGDAPTLGSTTFKNTSAGLTLYYIDGKTGWTSPTWEQSGVTYNTATFIPATHHAVTLPDIFTGTESVISGADYIFSQSTDGQYYTYTDVTATMSGEPVPVTHNGDGTYTIANVTGDLVISGTRTPKTELSLLLSDASGCTIHDGCLLGLPAGKTAGDVLALFANLPSGLSVHTADGTTVSASTHIGTGYTVQLTVDGTLYDTLTIVIRGDVNGDRFADELDLLFLQQYYAGHPVKPVHPLAGDINGDGMLTRAEVMLLSRTIAGWYAVSAASDSAAAFRLFRPSDLPA